MSAVCFWHLCPTKFLEISDILKMQILVCVYTLPLPSVFLSVALLALEYTWIKSIAAEAAIRKGTSSGSKELVFKAPSKEFCFSLWFWGGVKTDGLLFFAVWVTSLWTHRPYLPSSNITISMQPAGRVGFTPRGPRSASTCWVPALNQGSWCKGLIVLAAISQKQSFSILPILDTRWGIKASWLLEARALGPLHSPLERRPTAFLCLGQNFSFLECFWTTCIWAAIY